MEENNLNEYTNTKPEPKVIKSGEREFSNDDLSDAKAMIQELKNEQTAWKEKEKIADEAYADGYAKGKYDGYSSAQYDMKRVLGLI